MADLNDPLLQQASASNLRESVSQPSVSGRQVLFTWTCVDTSGNSKDIKLDKLDMMQRCNLPARDLRLLNPVIMYPSAILGREKAIVVNLEQIRCIIKADEVLLLNSPDSHSYVLKYVTELKHRLTTAEEGEVCLSDNSDMSRRRGSRSHDDAFNNTSPNNPPFEFRALDVALDSACKFLDTQAAELKAEADPLLDELTSKISASNLEHVRRLKSRLVVLTRRVQKVRDEIERLMDNDGDMAKMHLTKKKSWIESNVAASTSTPVSPVFPPPDARRTDKCLSIARSRDESKKSEESAPDSIVELEMLLEAYFVIIDSTLNKLTSLKEYIDDTEDFVNIQLDNVRNQLIQSELLFTMATLVVSIFGMVAGILGMNFKIPLFDVPSAFYWVLIITGTFGVIIFSALVCFYKYRGLMPF